MRKFKINIKYILIAVLVIVLIVISCNISYLRAAYKRHTMTSAEYMKEAFIDYLQAEKTKWADVYDNGYMSEDEIDLPAIKVKADYSPSDVIRTVIKSNNTSATLAGFEGDMVVKTSITPDRSCLDICGALELGQPGSYNFETKCDLANKSVTTRVEDLSDYYVRIDYGLYAFLLGDKETVDRVYNNSVMRYFSNGEAVGDLINTLGESLLDNMSEVSCERTQISVGDRDIRCYCYQTIIDLWDLDYVKPYIEEEGHNICTLKVYVDSIGQVVSYKIDARADICINDTEIGQFNLKLSPDDQVKHITPDKSQTIIIADEQSLMKYIDSIKNPDLKRELITFFN